MKRFVFLAAALLISAASAQAQKPKRAFLDCIDLPVESGVAVSPTGAAQSGMYLRMSVEYRPQNEKGWYASVEMGDFDMKFSNFSVEGMNVTAGTEVNTTILGGAGYRFPIVPEKVSVAVLAQAGVAFATLQNVSVDTDAPGKFELEDRNFSSPAGKLTFEAEYYVSKNLAILASAGYYHFFAPRPLEQGGVGTLAFTAGFTTFF